MSTLEAARESKSGGPGALAVRWLPPLLLLLAVGGVVLVAPAVLDEEDARSWYDGTLGGSELYRLNVIFARLVPFLAGGAIALALIQRLGRPAGEAHTAEHLKRHGWTEVFTHWVNSIGVVLCLITALWLLDWFGNPVSLRTAYIVHFIGAGFTLAAVAHHVTYHLSGGSQGLLPRSRRDVKNAAAEAVSYTGVYRGLPGAFGIQLPVEARRKVQPLLRRFDLAPDHAGKYLATEKVISYSGWAIVVGAVVLTGLIKALHYVYGMPGWLLQGVTFVHDWATVLIIVMLALHLFALVLVPRNWPLLKSMFTTRISRSYAREHLPLWEEQAPPKQEPERP